MEDRRKSIGGSDAPVICGVSKWKSPYQLYLEKTSDMEVANQDNEPMYWGRVVEPVIRQRYADQTGRTVIIPKGVLYHDQHPWMSANVDGITDGNPSRVVEIKTSRYPTDWGEPGSAEIPDAYMIQVQHYLSVTKLDVADVAALIAGSDFRLYEVPADSELQEMIIAMEEAFWEAVQNRTPPEPREYSDIIRKYGRVSKAVTVEASREALDAVVWLKQAKELMKKEEEQKAIIMSQLQEADTLIHRDQVLATWRAQAGSKRFDAKRFQVEHPDLYEQYLVQGEPVRRLLIK